MRYALAILLLVGCTDDGPSEQPPAWESTLPAFVDASCRWDWDCNSANREPDCVVEGTSAMNNFMRPRLQAAGQEGQCVACMQAWIEVYPAVTSPCRQDLTFDERQKIRAACTEDMSCVAAFHSPD